MGGPAQSVIFILKEKVVNDFRDLEMGGDAVIVHITENRCPSSQNTMKEKLKL